MFSKDYKNEALIQYAGQCDPPAQSPDTLPSNIFNDFTFMCRDGEVFAERYVLYIKVPYFKTHFTTEMKGGDRMKIDVPEYTCDQMNRFLNVIHELKLPSLSDTDLLCIFDRFGCVERMDMSYYIPCRIKEYNKMVVNREIMDRFAAVRITPAMLDEHYAEASAYSFWFSDPTGAHNKRRDDRYTVGYKEKLYAEFMVHNPYELIPLHLMKLCIKHCYQMDFDSDMMWVIFYYIKMRKDLTPKDGVDLVRESKILPLPMGSIELFREDVGNHIEFITAKKET